MGRQEQCEYKHAWKGTVRFYVGWSICSSFVVLMKYRPTLSKACLTSDKRWLKQIGHVDCNI